MTRTAEMERVEFRDLKFDVRPGTSDIKAVKEVVERRNYSRHGFTPGAGEQWIDLGANIGAFSIWAASQHRSILVDAYEPDADMCTLIEHNARLNRLHRQITITQAAVVADDRQFVTLHMNTARGNVWRNSIERTWQGGQDIRVPATSWESIHNSNAWVKMDIEGTEMPILEAMVTSGMLPLGMVFEWSFDVDRSIPRFKKVIQALGDHYTEVSYGGFDETVDEWPGNWFPPCRLVYCWNGGSA